MIKQRKIATKNLVINQKQNVIVVERKGIQPTEKCLDGKTIVQQRMQCAKNVRKLDISLVCQLASPVKASIVSKLKA